MRVMAVSTFKVLLGDLLVWVEMMWQSWVLLFWILNWIGIVVPCFYGHVLCLQWNKFHFNHNTNKSQLQREGSLHGLCNMVLQILEWRDQVANLYCAGHSYWDKMTARKHTHIRDAHNYNVTIIKPSLFPLNNNKAILSHQFGIGSWTVFLSKSGICTCRIIAEKTFGL